MAKQVYLSPLSVLIRPVERLIDEIRKYLRKKKLREQLISGLSTEIKTYIDLYKKFEISGEGQLIPLLRAEPVIPKINKIVRCIADMNLQYAALIESFVKLAQGCKLISLNKGFMDHLEEVDYPIYDFVNMVARTVVDDSLSIGTDFYKFFQLYGDEISGKVEGDVDEAIRELKSHIETLKSIKRNAHKARAGITRKTVKHFVESIKELRKANKKVRIHKIVIADLRHYVPKEMLPLVLVLEESLPYFQI